MGSRLPHTASLVARIVVGGWLESWSMGLGGLMVS